MPHLLLRRQKSVCDIDGKIDSIPLFTGSVRGLKKGKKAGGCSSIV